MEDLGAIKLDIRFEGPPSGSKALGQLHVLVQEARGLPATSSSGSCDPYVKLYLSVDGKDLKTSKHKTKTQKKTPDPVFEETIDVLIPSEAKLNANTRIQITTWDDGGKLGTNECMGATSFSMEDIRKTGNIHGWFKLLPEEDGRARFVECAEPSATNVTLRRTGSTKSITKTTKRPVSAVLPKGKGKDDAAAAEESVGASAAAAEDEAAARFAELEAQQAAFQASKQGGPANGTSASSSAAPASAPVPASPTSANGKPIPAPPSRPPPPEPVVAAPAAAAKADPVERPTSMLKRTPSLSSLSSIASHKIAPIQPGDENKEVGSILLELRFERSTKPEQFSGTIHVNIKEARGLPATNSSGTCDPYVKLYLSSDGKDIKQTKQKTHAQKKTADPIFEERLVAYLPPDVKLDDAHRLQITVWDDGGKLGTNECLGGTSFSIVEIAATPLLRGWFKLFPEALGRQRNLPVDEPPATDVGVRRSASQRSLTGSVKKLVPSVLRRKKEGDDSTADDELRGESQTDDTASSSASSAAPAPAATPAKPVAAPRRPVSTISTGAAASEEPATAAAAPAPAERAAAPAPPPRQPIAVPRGDTASIHMDTPARPLSTVSTVSAVGAGSAVAVPSTQVTDAEEDLGAILLDLRFEPPAQPDQSAGSVHVNVKEARGLPATNSSGSCDPYVKLYLSTDGKDLKQTKQKTRAQKKTVDPIFEERLSFDLPVTMHLDKQHRLQVTAWDDGGKLAVNDCLGATSFSLEEIASSSGIRGWFKLQREDLGRTQHVEIQEPIATGVGLRRSTSSRSIGGTLKTKLGLGKKSGKAGDGDSLAGDVAPMDDSDGGRARPVSMFAPDTGSSASLSGKPSAARGSKDAKPGMGLLASVGKSDAKHKEELEQLQARERDQAALITRLQADLQQQEQLRSEVARLKQSEAKLRAELETFKTKQPDQGMMQADLDTLQHQVRQAEESQEAQERMRALAREEHEREIKALRDQLARYASRDAEKENVRLREQIRELESKHGDRRSDLEDENRALRDYIDHLIQKLLDSNLDGFLEVAKEAGRR